MGQLFIASEVHYGEDPPEQWDIVLDSRDLDGPAQGQLAITDPSVSLRSGHPDLACVDDRFLAVTWRQRLEGGQWRAKLRLIGSIAAAGGSGPVTFDLGPAHFQAHVAVDATSDAIVTAWRRAGTIRFKRFDVAPSSVGATLGVVRTLATSGADGPIEIANSGERIVVAAMRGRDLVVRRSTDDGMTFRPQQTLLLGEDPCCFVAVPNSIDMRGERVLLEGARVYADFGGGVSKQRQFVSEDGGAHWSVVKLGDDGSRVGAWSTFGGGPPRIVEAWDDSWAPAPHHIRFRRQT
jgi:hypothetical protein